MLDDDQKEALRRWYREPKILDEARDRIANEKWEDLEDLLHMRCLIPLGKISGLPDYLKKDDGQALLPSLDPRSHLGDWQDAIEAGWEVIESELGVSRDEVHTAIGRQQKDDWGDFLRSVERRKRERGEKS